jgi:RNA polymerase sigma-70 factor (ECF subfamily)
MQPDPRFESLYRQHYPPLVKTLYYVVLDREAAADMAQEAFLELYVRWDKIGRYRDPIGWVYRVALNRSKDYRRKLARAVRLLDRLAVMHSTPIEDSWQAESVFVQAARVLPRKQREASALYYLAGFSTREIADVMGIAEGSVNSHLHRARRALMGTMEVEP